jgi:hypothetical protein
MNEAKRIIASKDEQIERMQQYQKTLLRQLPEAQGIGLEDD